LPSELFRHRQDTGKAQVLASAQLSWIARQKAGAVLSHALPISHHVPPYSAHGQVCCDPSHHCTAISHFPMFNRDLSPGSF